jgi:hypothetical protein
MLRLEEEARKAAPPTETEVLKHGSDNATLSRAHKMLEEGKDEVKHMNQMMQYAQVGRRRCTFLHCITL